MIDIGQLYKADRPQAASDTFAIRETRDVLQLLDSLKYVPRNLGEMPAINAAPLPPAQNVGAKTTDVEPLISLRSVPGASEGGMVAIAGAALIDKDAEPLGASMGEAGSVLDVPVQIDSVPGKYQAFEVSTAEAVPPPRAAPRSDETSYFVPRSTSAETIYAPPARPAPEASAAAVETTAAIDAVMELIEGGREAPLSLPQQAEEASGPSLNVAAALTFLALAAQAAYKAQLSSQAGLDLPSTAGNGRGRGCRYASQEAFRQLCNSFAPLERRS
jgi:hypothetical protein